ncbi:SWI2/SNF2 containing protein RAD16 [Toxoplasma gondii TgCatPRC2]|uniref:SWI2/SNF2 containing protein RAD16 n=1 Tax=Toxoplasma gondii TgCatPRC2 TaxID=1130821 RepID=A0A151HJ58_TOXGO|nr:SWI2/SNF2 containing protein RAD16 [Toxoplasma gondii TgCatPRC2]
MFSGSGGRCVDESASLDALFSAARRLPPLTVEECAFDPESKNWVPHAAVRRLKKKEAQQLRHVRLLVQNAPTGAVLSQRESGSIFSRKQSSS